MATSPVAKSPVAKSPVTKSPVISKPLGGLGNTAGGGDGGEPPEGNDLHVDTNPEDHMEDMEEEVFSMRC